MPTLHESNNWHVQYLAKEEFVQEVRRYIKKQMLATNPMQTIANSDLAAWLSARIGTGTLAALAFLEYRVIGPTPAQKIEDWWFDTGWKEEQRGN